METQEKPELATRVHTYVQSPDSNDGNRCGIQQLEITSESAGAGHFLIIKTDRWALDGDKQSIAAFCKLLTDTLVGDSD